MNNKLLSAASFLPKSLTFPFSWVGHIPFVYFLIQEVKPKIFVELGTHTGNSYFAFCQAVAENYLHTKCYAVDTWMGDGHTGRYENDVYLKVKDYNTRNYKDFSTLLRMTFDEALKEFEDGAVDLLHIDGLHTYDAVKHDFETWLPKLAPGAVVIFHDTQVHDRNFGVWKLWQEIQAEHDLNIEFTHSHGLGVVRLNNSVKKDKVDWLEVGFPQKAILKQYFSNLGSFLIDRCELEEYRKFGLLKDQLIAERDAQIAERDAQIAERDAQIAERDAQIATIFRSKSWRLTSPLRQIMGCFNDYLYRVRRIIKLISDKQKKIGFLGILKSLIRILENEGAKGLKVKIASSYRHQHEYQYQDWIKEYDTFTLGDLESLNSKIQKFQNKPLISIVMPTYNSNPIWLRQAIESVLNQIYKNWELCIADDASTNADVKRIIEEYAALDSRIKVTFRAVNGHISEASNSALALATGDWVALLDHDDVLSENALFWVADAINCRPDIRMIYSDEDKIDEEGVRSSPYFKCDWNEDLFYSHNMFCHLGVYQASLLKEVKGFRVGFEGAQDYDLALRCIERVESSHIYHIPRVLYHWRTHVGSTANSNSHAKPYAMIAGEKALNEHFQRKQSHAHAELIGFGYRVRYELPKNLPLVSLLIPTRNQLEILKKCIQSIKSKTTYPNYEIIVIDNGSDDLETIDYFDTLRKDSRVRVVRDDRPFNYSALNNAAVSLAKGDLIGLVNDDIEVISDEWLTEMVSHALRPEVGAVGARLWYPNDTLQHGGVILGLGGVCAHSHRTIARNNPGYWGRGSLIQSFSAVTGACLLVRKVVYLDVGGLDEKNLAVAYNDVDFCLRLLEAGYRNIWTPYAELYHHESASRGNDNDTNEKRQRLDKEKSYLINRWKDILFNDRAYNPNLTLDREDFSLAFPPRLEKLK